MLIFYWFYVNFTVLTIYKLYNNLLHHTFSFYVILTLPFWTNTPAKEVWGVYWFHPVRCLSVCPSVPICQIHLAGLTMYSGTMHILIFFYSLELKLCIYYFDLQYLSISKKLQDVLFWSCNLRGGVKCK